MKTVRIIVPNIRSLYNIGSIFRIADAAGIDKVYLTGYSGRPDKQQKISKTALGAEQTVAWEHQSHTWRVIEKLREEGFFVIGLERNNQSKDYRSFRSTYNKIAIVLGNEKTGILPPIQKRCDILLHLPMQGEKESLNVAVATGIMVYHLMFFT